MGDKLQIKPRITKSLIIISNAQQITKFLYQYELMRGGGGGGVAQKLDKRIRFKIFPCISSCRVVQGGGHTRGNFENQECRRCHIRSFCKAIKSQIYLNYAYLQMFQRKSPH